ncbi:MAG: type II/IV secretion system ATPase subunit [Candidatus Aenigmarchaeota archaeon]|nr:type II/IV secretion system ATPase subunit [Candidatus Aenigmarchaeota archaeon]
MESIKRFNLRNVTKKFAKRYQASIIRRDENNTFIKNTEQILARVGKREGVAIPNISKGGSNSSPIVIIEENVAPIQPFRSFSGSSNNTSSPVQTSVYPVPKETYVGNGVSSGINNVQNDEIAVMQSAISDIDKKLESTSVVGGEQVSINSHKNVKNTLKEDIKGVDLDNLEVKTMRVRKDLSTSDFLKTNIKYPLVPSAPKKGEKVYAWANIIWDTKKNSMVYNVVEPVLSPQDKGQIDKIKKVIEEEIDVDFKSFSKDSSTSYIESMMEKIIIRFNFVVDKNKLEIYKYYIIRDFVGLGALQPILNDSQIEDISCDGVGIPMYVYHRDPKLGSLQTNIILKTHEDLDTLVMRIAQKCGRSISMAEPLLQGSLPDGSRVQATLATDIASKGSNITIRRFLNEPLTPVHLLNFGTMDSRTLAYLWLAIEHGKSMLIVGATASGKTSLLNAISMFIKPSAKVVSIEDTPEIKLSHEHWVPEVSRAGFGEIDASGNRRGEVSMFDLLKGSLRQRPDYIIVGEIRGVEASVFFQQIATGHPGISTFHADSLEKVVDRLTTRPIDLSKSLLETLDLLVFAKRLKLQNGYVRRVTQVQEIIGYDSEKDNIVANKVFELNTFDDKCAVVSDSNIIGKISNESGISINILKDQLRERMKILEWMSDRYIINYLRVNEVINAYYNDSNTLMDLIGEDYGVDTD